MCLQWAFATTAVSIISGSLAERTQFTSFLISTAIVAGWVYPVIAHCTRTATARAISLLSADIAAHHHAGAWSDAGWLRNLGANGFIDYAGGGVVHMVGGGACSPPAVFFLFFIFFISFCYLLFTFPFLARRCGVGGCHRGGPTDGPIRLCAKGTGIRRSLHSRCVLSPHSASRTS